MHLTPRDIDKLMLHGAGFLAQKRLARGLRLNYPETISLLATQLLEMIRDGNKSVADLMDVGRRILGRNQVLAGVPKLIHEVQVEGTFPDGTKLVTVHDPISLENGDLNLALYGSFLPIPDLSVFAEGEEAAAGAATIAVNPGAIHVGKEDIELYEGRERIAIEVTSRGDRPIQVGSHYPFSQTNSALDFDRALAQGKHLDIPAGTAIRFEPGETRTITLVANADAPVPDVSALELAKKFERASGLLP